MPRLLVTWALVAIAASSGRAQGPERIDITEFRKLHAAKKVLVVDVRDAESFRSGHIPGAINIPLGQHEQPPHLETLKAEKRPIVTYCA